MWTDKEVRGAAKFLLFLIALVVAIAIVGCAKTADLAVLPLALLLIGLLGWSVFAKIPRKTP